MKDLEEINGSELVSVIKILNRSGFLEKEIRTVGVKKKDLLEHFADAYESLDAEAEEKMLKDKKYAPVIDFYEDTFSDELGKKEEGKEAEKEEEEEVEKEKSSKKDKKEKEKEKKEKAPKKEKTPGEKVVGRYAGSQAEKIDFILNGEGGSIEDIAKESGATIARTKRRINKLKQLGRTIIEENGIYRLAKGE